MNSNNQYHHSYYHFQPQTTNGVQIQAQPLHGVQVQPQIVHGIQIQPQAANGYIPNFYQVPNSISPHVDVHSVTPPMQPLQVGARNNAPIIIQTMQPKIINTSQLPARIELTPISPGPEQTGRQAQKPMPQMTFVQMNNRLLQVQAVDDYPSPMSPSRQRFLQYRGKIMATAEAQQATETPSTSSKARAPKKPKEPTESRERLPPGRHPNPDKPPKGTPAYRAWRAAKYREWRANLPPEKKAALVARECATHKKYKERYKKSFEERCKQNPELLEKRKRQIEAYRERAFKNLDPEKKKEKLERDKQKRKEKIAAMTPEEYLKYQEQVKERRRKYEENKKKRLQNMTEEELQQWREKFKRRQTKKPKDASEEPSTSRTRIKTTRRSQGQSQTRRSRRPPACKVTADALYLMLYEFKLGHNSLLAHQNITNALGNDYLTLYQVRTWFEKFVAGNMPFEEPLMLHLKSVEFEANGQKNTQEEDNDDSEAEKDISPIKRPKRNPDRNQRDRGTQTREVQIIEIVKPKPTKKVLKKKQKKILKKNGRVVNRRKPPTSRRRREKFSDDEIDDFFLSDDEDPMDLDNDSDFELMPAPKKRGDPKYVIDPVDIEAIEVPDKINLTLNEPDEEPDDKIQEVEVRSVYDSSAPNRIGLVLMDPDDDGKRKVEEVEVLAIKEVEWEKADPSEKLEYVEPAQAGAHDFEAGWGDEMDTNKQSERDDSRLDANEKEETAIADSEIHPWDQVKVIEESVNAIEDDQEIV